MERERRILDRLEKRGPGLRVIEISRREIAGRFIKKVGLKGYPEESEMSD